LVQLLSAQLDQKIQALATETLEKARLAQLQQDLTRLSAALSEP
jgi:hypothetical protein